MSFTFIAQDMEIFKKTTSGTSKIRNILDFHNGAEAYSKGMALCLGQLKTLFGEPLYITEDLENQYSYCILATDQDALLYTSMYTVEPVALQSEAAITKAVRLPQMN